ncbi:hypothetical protein [Candidatus Frankia alpina]|uniref:hypothetical protein n=1 Tax=Candidatus Frankia alpina TaxID=2699483 RepID=UPI001387137E|nr:hypothetical protein [Candidatus Frankia alpina]
MLPAESMCSGVIAIAQVERMPCVRRAARARLTSAGVSTTATGTSSPKSWPSTTLRGSARSGVDAQRAMIINSPTVSIANAGSTRYCAAFTATWHLPITARRPGTGPRGSLGRNSSPVGNPASMVPDARRIGRKSRRDPS